MYLQVDNTFSYSYNEQLIHTLINYKDKFIQQTILFVSTVVFKTPPLTDIMKITASGYFLSHHFTA